MMLVAGADDGERVSDLQDKSLYLYNLASLKGSRSVTARHQSGVDRDTVMLFQARCMGDAVPCVVPAASCAIRYNLLVHRSDAGSTFLCWAIKSLKLTNMRSESANR